MLRLAPFSENSLSGDMTLSPLSSRPKPDSDERRVTVDPSFPRGQSANSGISKTSYHGETIKLEYPSVDDLVEIAKVKCKG